MEARTDRRAPDVHRIPLDARVMLTHEDYEEPFDADGVDVSAGGLALRADYLPEVGDRLRCRFDCPPDGDEIALDGEVVWSHDAGERSGEFGLRFDALDHDAEAALLRMLADDAPGPGPRARLHLEAVATPIDAEVVERGDRSLTVEQELPFLRIGMGVVVEGSGPAHGRLDSVRLRIQEGVPRLVLGVEDTAAEEEEMAAPPDDDATLQDFTTLPELDREPAPEAPAQDVVDRVSERAAREHAALEAQPAEAPERDGVGPALARARETAWSVADRARPTLDALWAKLTLWIANARENLGPGVKRAWLTTRASARALGARLSPKAKRRTTSKPRPRVEHTPQLRRQHEPPRTRSSKKLNRLALAAVIALAGAGLGVYALSGEPPARLPLVKLAPAKIQPIEPAAEPVVEPEVEPAAAGGQLDEPSYPTLGEPEQVEAPSAPTDGTTFGAAEVPNAQTSTLRMSQPVTTLRGEHQEDGFTVTIPGSLALEGARGLAASNPNIDQSMILNRGDHSVLTIRFVAGRTPAYRVVANGAAIEISIER